MRKPTSSTQLAMFLFVDSWHELHDTMQCRPHGSTFEFLLEFQTEFFSNFLFKFQVVQTSNRDYRGSTVLLSELLPVLISGEKRRMNFGYMKGLTRFTYARPVL